jgi:hypothetical protein
VNKQKRLKFARRFNGFDFKKTIFSDEKIFRVRPGGHVKCWRLKSESRMLPKYLIRSTQKPEGVMVWAAMKADGSICIRRCPSKVNASAYQGILSSALSFIKPRFALTRFGLIFAPFVSHRGAGWRFQQDGASPHRALTTQAWLRRHKVPLLNRGFWPAMSPDLNPVEHLWVLASRKLSGCVFAGKDQLWSAIQEAFASITPAEVARLYDSMQSRLQCVRMAHGGPTRY